VTASPWVRSLWDHPGGSPERVRSQLSRPDNTASGTSRQRLAWRTKPSRSAFCFGEEARRFPPVDVASASALGGDSCGDIRRISAKLQVTALVRPTQRSASIAGYVRQRTDMVTIPAYATSRTHTALLTYLYRIARAALHRSLGNQSHRSSTGQVLTRG
jgi:hypothetical protein